MPTTRCVCIEQGLHLIQPQGTDSQPHTPSQQLTRSKPQSKPHLIQLVVGPKAQIVRPRLHNPHAAAVAALQVTEQQRGQAVVGVACGAAGAAAQASDVAGHHPPMLLAGGSQSPT